MGLLRRLMDATRGGLGKQIEEINLMESWQQRARNQIHSLDQAVEIARKIPKQNMTLEDQCDAVDMMRIANQALPYPERQRADHELIIESERILAQAAGSAEIWDDFYRYEQEEREWLDRHCPGGG